MRNFVLLGLVCVWACGAGGGTTSPDAPPNGNTCVPGSPFNLDGRMGVEGTLNVHINASGIVDTEATADLLLLLDVDETGTNLAVQATLCDLQIPAVPVLGQPMPIRFVLDPTVLDSVGQVTAMGTLGGTTTCSTLTSQPVTLLIGAKLSPITAPLIAADSQGNFAKCTPEPCAQALTTNCACDQEGDGHPGVSLSAQNVPLVPLTQIYVDVRTTFSLSGQVYSSDSVKGEIADTLEVGILGCSKSTGPCTNGDVNLVQTLNPTITQSRIEPSTFRAVRVSSTLTCAQLRAMRDTLFPR
ncbi:MAG TPA: hypothetical protein VKE22_28665 [Haliangiales bacterium]|nr:hypothetical protein [Haliangiales bacterium]